MFRIPLALAGSCALLVLGCADSTPHDEMTAADTAVADSTEPFIGTWELVGVERRTAEGELIPSENEPIGFLMYDPAGFMGVVIQGSNRQPSAGERRTPEEALAALRSYTSYFGAFTVDEAAGAVTHHLEGSLNPSGAGSDYRRLYEFEGNRLTLQPPTGPSGVVARLTWERVADLADLTPEHRRFVGFWRFAKVERYDENGESVPVGSTYDNGFIIYTASGHMAVHLVRPGRETYAEARQPTPEEAEAAMNTYASYFGPYTIHEADGYVVHHRIGITRPNAIGSDAQRFYELSDNQLILKPPAATVDGRTVQSKIFWERLGG